MVLYVLSIGIEDKSKLKNDLLWVV